MYILSRSALGLYITWDTRSFPFLAPILLISCDCQLIQDVGSCYFVPRVQSKLTDGSYTLAIFFYKFCFHLAIHYSPFSLTSKYFYASSSLSSIMGAVKWQFQFSDVFILVSIKANLAQLYRHNITKSSHTLQKSLKMFIIFNERLVVMYVE